MKAFLLSVWRAVTGRSRSIQIGLEISTSQTGYLKPVETNPQEMVLHRMTFTDRSTIGDLWIDGKIFCHTLEDTCRTGKKVPGETAIPSGRYLITMEYFNKYGRKMPMLQNVPGFTEIFIHRGNMPEDSSGCILVGDTKSTDFIGQSQLAFDRLLPIIKERTDNQMLYITILGGKTADV